MGTLRKKARTKAPAPADQTPVDQVEVKDVESTAATDSSAQSLRSKKSWYGTWPKKSVASTQIARESILADRPTNGSGSDLSRFDVRRAPPTSPSESVHSTNKHVVSGEVPEMANNTNQQQSSEQTEDDAAEVANPIVESEVVGEPTHPPSTTQQSKQSDSTDLGVPGSSGWFRWLGPTTEHDGTKPAPNDENPIPVAVSLDEHVRTVPDGSPDAKVSGKPGEAHNLGDASADDAAKDNGSEPQLSQASWYQFWSSNALPRMPAKEEDIRPAASQDATVLCVAENAAKPDKGETEDVPALAGSTWAFWSGPTKQAVQDPSKDLREPAEEIATLQEPGKSPLKQLEPSQVAKEKAAKAHSKQGSRDVSDSDRPTVKPNSVAKNEVVMQTTTTSPPNLILPSVRSTYRLVEDPSILQQLARLLHIGNQIPTKHVMLAKHAPRVRKAVAIGIHGLFILRRVIGSTGTSIRFVNHAAAAIKRWADAHDSGDCEIEKIALEGEGKINERVDNLWKLLLNWIEHIRRADTIMIACHSQGVPVAIMLIAKLIEFGVVTNARIGVCAMGSLKHLYWEHILTK